MLDFEWDTEKDEANQTKHKISFDEAIGVFADPDLLLIDASREEDGERRTKAIGQLGGKLFVVVYTERGNAVRIVSARRANKSEDRAYGDREEEA